MHEWISFLESVLSNNFTFSVIFVLGMFHALEPGHGKTLILAYMSGGSMRFFWCNTTDYRADYYTFCFIFFDSIFITSRQ